MRELHSPIDNLTELHAFVHRLLCESENLLSEQFVTRAQPLHSRGQLCAIEYSLLGLRAVRLGAIWAAEQNIVYFYNARGERFLKVHLHSRPDLTENKAAG